MWTQANDNRLRHLMDERSYDSLTAEERAEMYRLMAEKTEHRASGSREPDTRGANPYGRTAPRAGEVRGEPNEVIKAGQSVAEWHRKAIENRVPGVRNDGTDRDYERMWAEKFGLASRSAETRTLEESVTSGSGAGNATVPESWSTTFVDLLRPRLVLSDASILPMTTAKHTLPQYTQDVAPALVAEGSSVSLDGNPAFSPVYFDVTGVAYFDCTLVSRQLVEDCGQSGGIDALMRDVIGRKYARAVEQAALFGTSGHPQCPGLANESGIQKFAGEATLSDFDDLSKAAGLVRTANAEPTAAICSPNLVEAFDKLKASTYAKYWQPAPTVEQLWPPRYTTTMPTTETAGGAAETGGTTQSMFVGDFSRITIGWRTQLDVQILKERYADQGCYGILSYARWSIRALHPESFVRVTDYAVV